MIYVMLRCNIIPEFRARCPDMDPFPQRVPTSPRREASLLNLPGHVVGQGAESARPR